MPKQYTKQRKKEDAEAENEYNIIGERKIWMDDKRRMNSTVIVTTEVYQCRIKTVYIQQY
jgi:hypothetical protein